MATENRGSCPYYCGLADIVVNRLATLDWPMKILKVKDMTVHKKDATATSVEDQAKLSNMGN